MALWRNRLLLSAIETTYGTSPAMTGADAILLKELDVSPLEVELQDRELITGYFGNTEKYLGSRMSMAKFSVELQGSGTAGTAPKYGEILRACGFSETIVPATSVEYLPISTAQESVAMMFHAGGTQHELRGARGTCSFNYENGTSPMIDFELTCLYTAATSVTLPSATFTNQAKPLAFNSQNTVTVDIFGYAACLEALSLDMANEVIYRQLAGCTENVQLTDRKPAGTLKIEDPSLALKDYFANLSAQTLGNISLTHGTAAGNRSVLTMPSCNLGSIAYSDSEGIIMLDMAYMPNPVTGNDELSLLFN